MTTSDDHHEPVFPRATTTTAADENGGHDEDEKADELRAFITGFYTVSDDPGADDRWAAHFAPDAVCVMGDKVARGTEGGSFFSLYEFHFPTCVVVGNDFFNSSSSSSLLLHAIYGDPHSHSKFTIVTSPPPVPSSRLDPGPTSCMYVGRFNGGRGGVESEEPTYVVVRLIGSRDSAPGLTALKTGLT